MTDEAFLDAALALALPPREDVAPRALERFPPGREAALARLHAFDAKGYVPGRNRVEEPRTTSGLSPYLRHGLLTLPEVRDHVLASGTRRQVEKLVQELAWREFWRLVLERRGRAVFEDAEPVKHGHHRAPGLPDDLARGETGLSCVDRPLRELVETGYVHNHARMWVASAFTHRFQRSHAAGAALFARELLDWDPASNSLSWQWVDSTFAVRPYLYNRANVERYAPSFCAGCPARSACPFEGSYDQVAARFLGGGRPAPPPGDESFAPPPVEQRPAREELRAETAPPGPSQHATVAWVHGSALAAVPGPPDATVAVILDAPHLRAAPRSAQAVEWLARSALEAADAARAAGRDVVLAVGDPAQELVRLGAATVHAVDEPDPWVVESLQRLEAAGVRVERERRPLLAPGAASPTDQQLGRFSRWWRRAQKDAFRPSDPRLF